jgi:hypothetical protein
VNNDIALVPEWMEAVVPAVLAHGCAYSHRVDVNKFSQHHTMQEFAQARGYPGADLFAFTPAWWKAQRDHFPDKAVLGYEGWDFVMQWIMRKSGFDKLPYLCYHEQHQAFWARSENLQSHPVQTIIREQLTQWAKENGAQGHIGAQHNFLFHGILNEDDWARRPTLTVYGLAYNCENTVRQLLDSVMIATAGFKSVRYGILANNAEAPYRGTSAGRHVNRGTSAVPHSDATLAVLKQWARYAPQTRIVKENPGRIVCDSEVGRFRKMAILRNRVRGLAPLSDWNLMIDLDTRSFIDAGGITPLMHDATCDAVASYGIRAWDEISSWREFDHSFLWRGGRFVYYDLLAFEDLQTRRMLWQWEGRQPGVDYPHGTNIKADFTRANIIPPLDGGWHAVNSAFGPATFYRKNVFAHLRYNEKTEQAEHLTLHQQIRDHGGKIKLATDIIGVY